jgi:hypothetical protein
VLLVVPWVEPEQQPLIFPPGVVFQTRQEHAEYILKGGCCMCVCVWGWAAQRHACGVHSNVPGPAEQCITTCVWSVSQHLSLHGRARHQTLLPHTRRPRQRARHAPAQRRGSARACPATLRSCFTPASTSPRLAASFPRRTSSL